MLTAELSKHLTTTNKGFLIVDVTKLADIIGPKKAKAKGKHLVSLFSEALQNEGFTCSRIKYNVGTSNSTSTDENMTAELDIKYRTQIPRSDFFEKMIAAYHTALLQREHKHAQAITERRNQETRDLDTKLFDHLSQALTKLEISQEKQAAFLQKLIPAVKKAIGKEQEIE